ncbi:MAG TPA: CapA family protein [Noviherbaspirillum sp.]|jgi:poly-gamma-glutamate synthesis protein (capsule biosynthesis protein)|uniref:CapA family protein n=1 Tax=Noviherbaspirillum sp. TaxID=1926288 RepID=UPI002DDD1BFE|nr:CapA family protein [Noviherbaspirillum sp.]HEV2610529.1 CapA family protein [Noviherbaspirillum sp.]
MKKIVNNSVFSAAVASTFLAAPTVAADPTHANEGKMASNWIQANVSNGFTLTAVGDLIITEPIHQRMKRTSPDLLKLLQNADVIFGNFEDTAIDINKFGGYPDAMSGGGWLISSPKVPADLRAMGFNLVARANNHTTDWGVKGMRYTNNLLDEAGITHAGTGETLAEARAARILSVPAGRISLVSIASRFELNSRAADPLGQIPGRPGLNALRTTRYVMVSPERLAVLAKIRDAQPKGSVRKSLLESDAKTDTVTLFGTKYRASPGIGDGLAFTFSMDAQDRKEIIRAVRQGKQTSDFAIATIHTHEPGNYSDVPPDFLPILARESIDNGADAFIGHGPHQLRGIEIYKGKPIFYSLGNFFFMDNTQQPITRDEFEKDKVDPASMTEAEFMEMRRVHGVFKERVWFESAVAVSRFDEQGNLREIRLHPIELHWEGGRDADRGIPRIASPEVAKRVLEQLQKLSRPFGTKIDIQNGVGLIRVGA